MAPAGAVSRAEPPAASPTCLVEDGEGCANADRPFRFDRRTPWAEWSGVPSGKPDGLFR